MGKILKTPVLFMVFNRPEKTQIIFESIRAVKPLKLYIAADAPRSHVATDAERCNNVREIVQKIDWACEVKYLFHEQNVGCSMAGKLAWDWAFSYEEEIIFIEDDGLANASFFWYCEELLEKYRFDTQVAYIGGVNYGITYGNSSYFFSRPPAATYCMATWKRVYNLYEYRIDSFHEVKNLNTFRDSFINLIEYKIFCKKCEKFIDSGGNTYDLQMNYLVHKHNMYSIYPNTNMVSNIGLDGGANNMFSLTSKFAKRYGNRPRFEMVSIIHPPIIEINKRFEKKHIQLRVFYRKSWIGIKIQFYFLSPLRTKLRSLFVFFKNLKDGTKA